MCLSAVYKTVTYIREDEYADLINFGVPYGQFIYPKGEKEFISVNNTNGQMDIDEFSTNRKALMFLKGRCV